MKIDELNYFSSENEIKRNILNIEDFFNGMELPDKEKEQRIRLAHKLQDVLLFILSLYLIQVKNDSFDQYKLTIQLTESFLEIIDEESEDDDKDKDDYIRQYIKNISEQIIDTTVDYTKEIANVTQELDEDNWWLSPDRTMCLAEDVTNAVRNYERHNKALKEGQKYKIWRTERDNRVRTTHKMVDGVKKPINEPYIVGDSLLQFPCDTSYSADIKEIARCRCVLKYTKE